MPNRNLIIISLLILLQFIPSELIMAAQVDTISSGQKKVGTVEGYTGTVQLQDMANNDSFGNLALNKSYTRSELPHPNFPDANNESTNGRLAGDYPDGKSYGYSIPSGESKIIDVIIDLGSASNITSVKVHKWEGLNPYDADTITVATSPDGTSYSPFGGTPTLNGLWHNFSSAIINTRYVKVRFTKYNNGNFGSDWLFIDEIQVYENDEVSTEAKPLDKFEKVLDKNISAVYLSPTFESDKTVYVISANQLYRSRDGGNEWEEIMIFIDYVHYTNRNQYLYSMLCEGNGIVYLSGYYAYETNHETKYEYFLIKSTDDGNLWHLLYKNAFYNLILANDTLFGINDNTGYLQKSDDKGSSWNWTLNLYKEFRNYAFATTDGQNLWAIYDNKLWSSNNNSVWVSYNNVISNATRIYAYAGKDQNILITCSPDKIMEGSLSTDNATWHAMDFSSVPQVSQSSLYCADATSNGFIVLGISTNSILISNDNGKTWKIVAEGLIAPASYIQCSRIEDSLFVFAGTSQGLFRMQYDIIEESNTPKGN
jgi:hypothetical protein